MLAYLDCHKLLIKTVKQHLPEGVFLLLNTPSYQFQSLYETTHSLTTA